MLFWMFGESCRNLTSFSIVIIVVGFFNIPLRKLNSEKNMEGILVKFIWQILNFEGFGQCHDHVWYLNKQTFLKF